MEDGWEGWTSSSSLTVHLNKLHDRYGALTGTCSAALQRLSLPSAPWVRMWGAGHNSAFFCGGTESQDLVLSRTPVPLMDGGSKPAADLDKKLVGG